MRLRRTDRAARCRPAAASDHSALSSLRSLRLALPDQTQITLLQINRPFVGLAFRGLRFWRWVTVLSLPTGKAEILKNVLYKIWASEARQGGASRLPQGFPVGKRWVCGQRVYRCPHIHGLINRDAGYAEMVKLSGFELEFQ